MCRKGIISFHILLFGVAASFVQAEEKFQQQTAPVGSLPSSKISYQPRLLQEDEDDDEEDAEPAPGGGMRRQPGINPILGVGSILSNLVTGNINGVVDSALMIRNPPQISPGYLNFYNAVFGSNATNNLIANRTVTTPPPPSTTTTVRPLTLEYIQELQNRGILNSAQALLLQQGLSNPNFPDPNKLALNPGGVVGGSEIARVQPIKTLTPNDKQPNTLNPATRKMIRNKWISFQI